MGKILDSIPLSIQIKDIEDNYRYLFCNKESTRMFGSLKNQTVNDIMDKHLSDKIHQIDCQVFSTGNPYFGHEKIVLKDGRSYDTIMRKVIIEDNKKRLVLSTYWDMSLQKELERKSKFFSISLNALNAYTWYYDIDKDILTCRDGVEKLGQQIVLWHNLDAFINCIHPEEQEYVRNTMYGMCSKKMVNLYWNIV